MSSGRITKMENEKNANKTIVQSKLQGFEFERDVELTMEDDDLFVDLSTGSLDAVNLKSYAVMMELTDSFNKLGKLQ